MFNLEDISKNIVSQIMFIVFIIMAVRAVASYIRQDWGAFFSGLTLGICVLIVVLFGPQIQDFAQVVGDAIFGDVGSDNNNN